MENKIAPKKKKVLIGVFPGREKAEQGFKELIDRQYDSSEINIIMSNDTRDKLYSEIAHLDAEPQDRSSLIFDGIKTGGTTGGILAGIAAFIAALGVNLAIPGLSLVALGPIMAALIGAGAGGIAGGFIGALMAYNVPEAKATLFNEELKKGKILLAVHPCNLADTEKFEAAWKNIGAEQIFNNGYQPQIK